MVWSRNERGAANAVSPICGITNAERLEDQSVGQKFSGIFLSCCGIGPCGAKLEGGTDIALLYCSPVRDCEETKHVAQSTLIRIKGTLKPGTYSIPTLSSTSEIVPMAPPS